MSVRPESDAIDTSILQRQVVRERTARESAERLLEEKSLELYHLNVALQENATALEQQVQQVQSDKARIEELLRTDQLTQLLNRTSFLEHLRGLVDPLPKLKKKEKYEVWFAAILVKRFKRINALVGQSGGDKLLQEIAIRLQSSTGLTGAKVARFSGTEFAIAYSGGREQFQDILEDFARAMKIPIEIGERVIPVDYAIAAASTKTAGENLEALRNAVDAVLSKARRIKSRTILFFDEAVQKEIQHRNTLEKEVRSSIQKSEFVSWFQPIMNANNATSIRLEALARWPKHGGIIQPPDFISAANDLGLWAELNKQLVESACSQAKPLIDSGLVEKISINISPADFISPDFIGTLETVLHKTKFPSEKLVIELTENAFIEDWQAVKRQIRALHTLNMKIAIDDFGAGYSNLRNLIDLPIDSVKIDRSLIEELGRENRATMLISTLVQWARAIDVSVVAEGVENETQAMLLRALGCNRLQGFHFGRAMPSASLVDRIPLLVSRNSVLNPGETPQETQISA